jgi:hypothetical protein
VSGDPHVGSLAFRRLFLSGLEISETSTPLRVEADSVGLDEGLAMPVLDGALGLERLRLVDALRPSRRVESAVLLHRLDLGEAAKAFGLPPLEGKAGGYFPRVVLTGPTFLVEGASEIDLFGGKLVLEDISGEDMLTRFPKMGFSARFEGIDLARVTKVFDFGAMTGVVRGHVGGCELFRWAPVRFEALVETDSAGGERSRIDVKAINNIAILGTGGRVTAFDRGLHRFLDTYFYSRLGIAMSLDGDVFLVRGLERRGERELFLKGRLPLVIDVVNAQPGRTVSFRTMLERVKALDFETSASLGTRTPKRAPR